MALIANLSRMNIASPFERTSGRPQPGPRDLATAARGRQELCAPRERATWRLLEGLLHDHLDAGDHARRCFANLLDGFLADLARASESAGRRRRGRLLGIEADLLGAGDGALHGVPGDAADVAADLRRALDEDTRARAHGIERFGTHLLGALQHPDDGAFGRSADVTASLGRADNSAVNDVGHGRGQRGADGAGALDGAHQRAADGVDDSVHDLAGAFDRADQTVFHRLHEPLVFCAHLGPPSEERYTRSDWKRHTNLTRKAYT